MIAAFCAMQNQAIIVVISFITDTANILITCIGFRDFCKVWHSKKQVLGITDKLKVVSFDDQAPITEIKTAFRAM